MDVQLWVSALLSEMACSSKNNAPVLPRRRCGSIPTGAAANCAQVSIVGSQEPGAYQEARSSVSVPSLVHNSGLTEQQEW